MHPTTGNDHSSTRRRLPSEWPGVVRFKTELDIDNTSTANHSFCIVPVYRQRRDKRPNGLIAEGFLSLHEQARNLKHYVVCVVGQNAFLVRSCPCNPPS